jgi:hypothetical protein
MMMYWSITRFYLAFAKCRQESAVCSYVTGAFWRLRLFLPPPIERINYTCSYVELIFILVGTRPPGRNLFSPWARLHSISNVANRQFKTKESKEHFISLRINLYQYSTVTRHYDGAQDKWRRNPPCRLLQRNDCGSILRPDTPSVGPIDKHLFVSQGFSTEGD